MKLPEQLEAAEVFRRLCEQGRMRLMAARSWNADKALKSRKSSHFHQVSRFAIHSLFLSWLDRCLTVAPCATPSPNPDPNIKP